MYGKSYLFRCYPYTVNEFALCYAVEKGTTATAYQGAFDFRR